MHKVQLVLSILSLALTACHSSLQFTCDGNCENGYGTKRWDDGSYTKSNWKDGKAYGQGIRHWGSSTTWAGDTYVGSFVADSIAGQGTYSDSSTSVTKSGFFRKGQPNGYGSVVCGSRFRVPNAFYKGYLKDGKFEGWGTYRTGLQGAPHTETYVGNWKDDQMSGYGTYYWPNGRRYEGQFKNNMRNGKGTFTFEDGYQYIGYWINGHNEDMSRLLAMHDSLKIKTGQYKIRPSTNR